ncbi:MAG TPA: exopolysaccharide biosynthesis polyprenyl glycosylphosphotransferase [Bryobacteraceae bacterium]|jgi:Undecaprenyl-phosphate galactose phosphotransferase WbaP|nr:exopolysaccharide biosynthesis polyprenyl glycosylphosphotransferase [Bryobacteraceae bacterium]
MSTAARAKVSIPAFQATNWTPWAILASDVVALEAALGLGLGVRRMLAPWFTASIGVEQYFAVAVGILLLPIVYYQLGIYPGYLLGPVERLRRRTLATLAVFGGLVAWDNIVARGVLSRGVLLATFLFALVLPPLAESLVRKALAARKRWGIPVVMIGAGSTGRLVVRTLRNEPQLGLVPIAFLDNRPDAWNQMIENVPVAGPLGLAQDFESRAEAAIVALADLDRDDVTGLLQELNFPRVIVIPQFTGVASLWVTARDVGGCLGLEIKKNLLMPRNLQLKRMMDRAVAIPLFLMSIPVMAAAAVWIKTISRGPVFHCQLREGVDGRRIAVWKLRTMRVNSESLLESWFQEHPEDRVEWARYFKLRHDPRVLPWIGTALRRTSLDELPQLWSVLKGEMSLVGPRPFPDYHLEQFPTDFRALRRRVLPGLTGMWQVSARSEGDVHVQEALDTYYIRNWSPWLDLYILARTVSAVIMARGAY